MIEKANNCREQSNDRQHLLDDLIFNNCIKIMCMMLRLHLQKWSKFEQILGILNRYMELLQLRQESWEDSHKDMYIVVMKLVEYRGVDCIFTHCFQGNEKTCLQFEVLMKLIPSISDNIGDKGLYLKHME